MNADGLIIGVDFDGTVVEHRYPEIGKVVPGAMETLRYVVAKGAKLILWTVRDGAELEQAVEFMAKNGVPLFGVNENPTGFSSSPKAYCHVYVDDCAIGCPLIPATETKRRMVDWRVVGPALQRLVAEPHGH